MSKCKKCGKEIAKDWLGRTCFKCWLGIPPDEEKEEEGMQDA
jgi:hypothetical protein